MHEFPQSLVPPFAVHQVSGHFRREVGEDLAHETPQSLVPPFSLHQVSGHFRRAAATDLVHESPQALVPPFPLHQVSSSFWLAAATDLVHEFPQALDPPFPLHQVSDSFRPTAGHVGAWLPAKPYSTVGPRQHRHLGPGRRGARRRRNKGLRGGEHHVRPAAGALAPEDVVPGDERIRVCGERRTTSGLSHSAPATPTPLPAPTGAPGSFCGYAFHQFTKKV